MTSGSMANNVFFYRKTEAEVLIPVFEELMLRFGLNTGNGCPSKRVAKPEMRIISEYG